jgi:transposase InsO family protein
MAPATRASSPTPTHELVTPLASRTELSAIAGPASPLRGSDTHTTRSNNRQSASAYSSRNHKAVLRRSLEPGQYVSLAFGQTARAAGIAQSMGSRGECFDNAVAESFFATLKKELVNRRPWPQKAELRSEIFDYIEIFYNRQRRHGTLGMRSPADFENSTLRPCGPGLAASRLAAPQKMRFTAPTAAAVA